MDKTFATIGLHEIKLDCRHYTGYRPCRKHDGCPECPHYTPRGGQILLIKLGAMGDVLRTKSVLPALKRAHPESWIVWLTEPGSEAIVRDPLVDEIRTFTPAGIAAIEGRRYVRLACLDKDPHALALSARLDADLRQGFAPTPYNTVTVWNEGAMDALRLGLSDEFKFRINRKTAPHIVHDMLGLEFCNDRFRLQVPQEARRAARDILESLEVPPRRPIVGLNTGCGPVFATKGWTTEGMIDFIRLMAGEGVSVLLLGGPREEPLHREIMSACPDRAGAELFDSGNRNSLETFFALVEACDAVVTSDSRAMHVATALDRGVVAFFGPTCEQEVDLFGLGEKIVTDFPCSPCYLRSCDKSPTCMQALAGATVAAAVRRVLDARR